TSRKRPDENAPVTVAWAIGALVVFAASLVMGLAGFGSALVAMAFLPWVMSPVTAVVLLTIYALVSSVVVVVPLVREIVPDVWQATAAFAVPALAGVVAGVALFDKLDPVRFRRVVIRAPVLLRARPPREGLMCAAPPCRCPVKMSGLTVQ